MGHLKDFQVGTNGDPFNGPVNGTVGATTPATASVTTLTTSSTVTHNGGTANGVAYLNGSKVLTTGSALTFDGTNVFASGSGAGYYLNSAGAFTLGMLASGSDLHFRTDGTPRYKITSTGVAIWEVAGTEQMRLTSTGLGIGTSSPASKLNIGATDATAYLDSSSTGQAGIGATLQLTNLATAGNAVSQILFNMNNDRVINRIVSSYTSTTDGYLAFVTEGAGTPAERMRIDSSGNLLVGTTSALTNSTGISVSANGSNNYSFFARNTSGTSGSATIGVNLSNASATTSGYFFLYATNGAGSAYGLRADGSSTFSSDRTLKKNIVDSRGYLDDLMKLRPVKYHWKTQDDNDSEKWLGLIAQEVEEVFPGLVCEDKAEEGKTPTKAVKYSVLPMMMLKAIQELKAEFDAYKATHP
jgi:hypothetical protein